MREFSTSISAALANGLKPDESFRDTMFFEDLYNLVPAESRLRSYQEITDVLPISQNKRKQHYPFPQWFRFEDDNILLTKEDIYRVEEYPNPPFDLKSVLLDIGQNFSESFRSADYGNNWILLNREGCIYKYNRELNFSNELKAASVIHHENRTVIGGPLDGFWTDDFLQELDKMVGLSNLDNVDLDLSRNFIFWSGYDSKYFPYALFDPDIMFNDFTETDPFTELLYSNSFGYMEMPFKGDVLDIISSNNQVFCFGEDGICSVAVNPQASGASFHITGQQPFGIKQRGAVGGDDSSLVFIDVFNQLWHISGEGMRKLDYSDYMEQLSGEIWITKDPEEDLFYIGDSEISFLLSDQKLTRVFQTVQQAIGAYPYRAGVALQTGDKRARLRSSRLDIGNTDNKTLTGVAIGADSEVSGTVKGIAQIDESEFDTPRILLNPEGYGATRIYGSNHKVEIVLEDYKNLNIDHIELKWQIDDRRQRRGTFATQDSTGAG